MNARFLIYVIACVASAFFAAGLTRWFWDEELIERNLAIFCPHNGNFAFVGACEE